MLNFLAQAAMAVKTQYAQAVYKSSNVSAVKRNGNVPHFTYAVRDVKMLVGA